LADTSVEKDEATSIGPGLNAELAGRPELQTGTSQTLYPGMTHLNENTVINVKNKSYTISAEFEVPQGGASGAIIAQGGRFAGWSLYLLAGVPAHCYNWFDKERYYVRGKNALTPGTHTLRYAFAYDGGGVGKGGTGTLFVDDTKAGQVRVEKTVAFIFSGDDFMDIGEDSGAPVVEEYDTPGGRFTGKINWVRMEIGTDAHEDHEGKQLALAARS
jgi:arylsulfatase